MSYELLDGLTWNSEHTFMSLMFNTSHRYSAMLTSSVSTLTHWAKMVKLTKNLTVACCTCSTLSTLTKSLWSYCHANISANLKEATSQSLEEKPSRDTSNWWLREDTALFWPVKRQKSCEGVNLKCAVVLEPSWTVPECREADGTAPRSKSGYKPCADTRSIKLRFVSVFYEPKGRFANLNGPSICLTFPTKPPLKKKQQSLSVSS